jgi:SAM-dependent methyltransferase
MAHTEQRNFCKSVKAKYPDFFKNKKVLDIGSLDINGSNRDLFENCDYTGLDVGEGKNVDIISIGHLFNGPDNHFDTIISTEVFEHDMFYEETIKNVMRMLKPGGLFLFTCGAPGRPEHGTKRTTPHDSYGTIGNLIDMSDYYKNLTEIDLNEVLPLNKLFSVWDTYFNSETKDLYFVGIKKGCYTFTS